MLSYKIGIVKSILEEIEDITVVQVKIESEIYNAMNYKVFTGEVRENDKVVLNTTAVNLNLGTGGLHYIMFNYRNKVMNLNGSGHIMKLRYTPYQIRCLVAEEENSPYHSVFNNFKSLNNHICIVATLHSMVGPIASIIKYICKDIKINYIMTDGGALPISFSRTIRELKNKEILGNTITIGHAFGGDLECINIYTGLIASKEILGSDITIISMGPGIVGTGTKFGFTGIEQGYIIDSINNIGGKAMAVPRISFKDERKRHQGISHHTITVLSEITNTRANLVLPYLDDHKKEYIIKQIKESSIDIKHNIDFQFGDIVEEAMKSYGLNIKSMGRTIDDDRDYFLALGSVGTYAANYIIKEDKNGI